MPRVLRIINRLNLGGPTFNASILSKYLEPEFETLLLAGEKDDSEESSEFIPAQLGLKPQFIKGMRRALNPLRDYMAYVQIKKIIKEFKPDIVHTHAAKAGAVGRLAAIHCKVPVIIHTFHGHVFHSYFSPLKTQFFIGLERWLASQSSAIVAISDLQKKELTKRYHICEEVKAHVVNLGFDLSKFEEEQEGKRQLFREKWKLDSSNIAVGIVGRLVPIKNHEFFLQSIAKCVRSNPEIKAFVIGDGELRSEIESCAIDLGLVLGENDFSTPGANILFTSWIHEMDEAMAGLDMVVLSSRNEGTPVSLIEAQAAAVPIVSTDVGGVRDTMCHEQSGFVVNQDVDEISKAILRLADDETLRKEMGVMGREFAFSRFDKMRLVDDIRTLYNDLLAANKPSGVI
jgi:glycosyltransferase involved in cell wall biosynthesis